MSLNKIKNENSKMKLTNQRSGKETEVNSNIRISYFTVHTNKGIGYVCVALLRPEKGSTSNSYRAAFSSYSPLDNKSFSKVNARNAAIGRLLCWRTDRKDVTGKQCETNPRLEFNYVDYDIQTEKKLNLKDVFVQALNLAMHNRNVPSWVERSSFIAYGLDPVMVTSIDAPSPVVFTRESRNKLKKQLNGLDNKAV